MEPLSGGAVVIARGELAQKDGTRRYRTAISRKMGARDIAQYVNAYSEGVSKARRNPVGEEVIYVVNGNGICYIDGYSYSLDAGTAVYIPPGSVYQIENLDPRGRGVVQWAKLGLSPDVSRELSEDGGYPGQPPGQRVVCDLKIKTAGPCRHRR
jgi:mannose-6-phosphate isomerase-like protein (cupin superfamily)